MYKVTKKDGSVVDFDRSRIVNGVVMAGGSAEEAERVAGEVEAWLPSVAGEGTVNVTDIRVKVLEVLSQVNPGAAATFEAYQKPSVAEETPSAEPEVSVEPETEVVEEVSSEEPVTEESTDPVL